MKNTSFSSHIGMWLALLVVTCVYAVSAMAQTNAPPGLGDIPSSAGQYWDMAIAAVSPIIVWLIRLAVPKIPAVLLPAITPLIGVGLGLILNQVANANLSWVDMAKAGGLAVFVREVVNQGITKRLQKPEEAGLKKS
jgi:hypothetical protein